LKKARKLRLVNKNNTKSIGALFCGASYTLRRISQPKWLVQHRHRPELSNGAAKACSIRRNTVVNAGRKRLRIGRLMGRHGTGRPYADKV
jgi:hypothetical protein